MPVTDKNIDVLFLINELAEYQLLLKDQLEQNSEQAKTDKPVKAKAKGQEEIDASAKRFMELERKFNAIKGDKYKEHEFGLSEKDSQKVFEKIFSADFIKLLDDHGNSEGAFAEEVPIKTRIAKYDEMISQVIEKTQASEYKFDDEVMKELQSFLATTQSSPVATAGLQKAFENQLGQFSVGFASAAVDFLKVKHEIYKEDAEEELYRPYLSKQAQLVKQVNDILHETYGMGGEQQCLNLVKRQLLKESHIAGIHNAVIDAIKKLGNLQDLQPCLDSILEARKLKFEQEQHTSAHSKLSIHTEINAITKKEVANMDDDGLNRIKLTLLEEEYKKLLQFCFECKEDPATLGLESVPKEQTLEDYIAEQCENLVGEILNSDDDVSDSKVQQVAAQLKSVNQKRQHSEEPLALNLFYDDHKSTIQYAIMGLGALALAGIVYKNQESFQDLGNSFSEWVSSSFSSVGRFISDNAIKGVVGAAGIAAGAVLTEKGPVVAKAIAESAEKVTTKKVAQLKEQVKAQREHRHEVVLPSKKDAGHEEAAEKDSPKIS